MGLALANRTCRTCGHTKPPSDFYTNRRVCKSCLGDGQKRNRLRDPAAHSARTRAWQRANPDKVLDARLRRDYGISLDEYQHILQEQGGACAVCRMTCRTGTRLAVDHDHETGAVRGLLCRACNAVLGLMADSPDRLNAAAAYLSKGSQ